MLRINFANVVRCICIFNGGSVSNSNNDNGATVNRLNCTLIRFYMCRFLIARLVVIQVDDTCKLGSVLIWWVICKLARFEIGGNTLVRFT